MKKLSKITESVWGDIRKQGLGISMKEEDNVNTLDINDFFEYLNNNYRIDNCGSDFELTDGDTIFIPFCTTGTSNIKLGALYYERSEDDGNIVYTHRTIPQYIPELWNKIEKNFDLWVGEPDYERYVIINPKDTSRKVDNSYLLEVLNFIIDNLDSTATPAIFRKTTESVWGDIRKRGLGDEVKEEDILTNLKELVPVDMGTTVLWADKDLEYKNENDASYFTYEEVEDIVKKSEWRIPTKDEYIELFKYTKKIKNTDNVFITEGDFDDKPQLIFNKKGYMYGGDFNTINYISHYCAWTSTPHEPEGYYMVDINHLPVPGYFSMHYLNKGCIRLVKDRK